MSDTTPVTGSDLADAAARAAAAELLRGLREQSR